MSEESRINNRYIVVFGRDEVRNDRCIVLCQTCGRATHHRVAARTLHVIDDDLSGNPREYESFSLGGDLGDVVTFFMYLIELSAPL